MYRESLVISSPKSNFIKKRFWANYKIITVIVKKYHSRIFKSFKERKLGKKHQFINEEESQSKRKVKEATGKQEGKVELGAMHFFL